ncbi:MAG TPA: low-specificity L-threonine aldolase [Bacillales bacterium]
MIDLRSDTVTKPTEEMRKAIYNAEVGDDVYGEDPTVNLLEKKAAELLGKEAALFVTSGTQGNQIAVLTHCRPGNEIILEEEAHIYYYEGAAISALAGVQPRPVRGVRGVMNPSDVEAAVRGEDIHYPETGLICIENTHNRAGGAVVPLEKMREIYEVAGRYAIPVHLDGARLFNAAVATNTPVAEFAAYTDTVQFCLSKGLGAPVGSIIAGDAEFIARGRKWRKRLGGGLRQAGILAAAGIVALDNHIDRLEEDHHQAKMLADGLSKIEGLTVENKVETNIVVVNVGQTGHTSAEFVNQLKDAGILAGPFGPETVRFTTHYDVSTVEIQSALEKITEMLIVSSSN